MDDNGDKYPFTSRLDGGKPPAAGKGDSPGERGELVAPGDIYATAAGQRLALALEFIYKDGASFTVPYAFLPVLWRQPPDTLVIEYPGLFSVMLRGRELDELHRRIKDQRLTWVRSSTSTGPPPCRRPSPGLKSFAPTPREAPEASDVGSRASTALPAVLPSPPDRLQDGGEKEINP